MIETKPAWAHLKTEGKWWWDEGHIAGHMYDPYQSRDGMTLLRDCPKCVEPGGSRARTFSRELLVAAWSEEVDRAISDETTGS